MGKMAKSGPEESRSSSVMVALADSTMAVFGSYALNVFASSAMTLFASSSTALFNDSSMGTLRQLCDGRLRRLRDAGPRSMSDLSCLRAAVNPRKTPRASRSGNSTSVPFHSCEFRQHALDNGFRYGS